MLIIIPLVVLSAVTLCLLLPSPNDADIPNGFTMAAMPVEMEPPTINCIAWLTLFASTPEYWSWMFLARRKLDTYSGRR